MDLVMKEKNREKPKAKSKTFIYINEKTSYLDESRQRKHAEKKIIDNNIWINKWKSNTQSE